MINSKLCRHPSIQTTALPDGHAVLMSKDTEWAFTITPVAAIAWEFCDGTNTFEEIVAHVQAVPEFEPVTANLSTELAPLFEELTDAGFLIPSEDYAPLS